MTIGAVGQINNLYSVSSTVQGNSIGRGVTAESGSSAKKDSATISNAAKELAAQKAGTTSQEEAAESVSEKLSEQISGRD